MEPIEGSETSAFKPQTPGKYPKENILHKEHGESLKSRLIALCWYVPWLQEGGQDRLVGSASDGRTTYQPVLTTFLQPRHIPTQGYNITQSSAPDDRHMVARNMLSNY